MFLTSTNVAGGSPAETIALSRDVDSLTLKQV
jgi:hypothetical protein